MLFRRLLRNFVGDRGGNVAPIFALAMIPVIGFVGAAVDYSRAASARTSLQGAVDATALFLSREAQGMTPEQVQAKGQEYFNSIFHNLDAKNIQVTTEFVGNAGDYTVKVTAKADVNTRIIRVLGPENIPISTSSDVVWGMERLEVALVLDNTTSMADHSRMVELKKATKSLLATLKTAATNSGKPDAVKVAIIPYGTEVNVRSIANTDPTTTTWLDWGSGQDLAPDVNRPWPYWQHIASQGRWMDPPPIFKSWIESAPANRRLWDLTHPGRNTDYPVRNCPFTAGTHGFGCADTDDGLPSVSNNGTATTIPSTGDDYAGLICPSRDDGTKWTSTQQLTQAGVQREHYYNGCWNSRRRDVQVEQGWYRIRVRTQSGTNPTCGSGNQSATCSCYGSGANQFCALDPNVSNWPSGAQGDQAKCPSSVTNPDNTSVVANQDCRLDSNGRARLRPYDHFWRPSENAEVLSAERSLPINLRATPTPQARWAGCVRDRDQNYDADDTSPTSTAATKFQPVQAANCEGTAGLVTIMPLTTNWTDLDAKVDAMNTGNSGGTPSRATNVTIGLVWGWHALFSNDPMDQAEAPKDDLKKVIILMTDGDNTENRWNRFTSTTGNPAIDVRTQLACSNLKDLNKTISAGKFEMYTVRLMDGNEVLLQNCATKPDMYYNVQQASQLNMVFNAIAKNLASLRIVK